MEFGVVLSSSRGVESILSAAAAAEENGLDYFFVTDHYMLPNTNSTADAWSALSAIAATTRRVRIGTCVTPIPFRPPSQLAKVVATVDQISHGRAILGVGCGWSKSEFMGYSSWDDDGRVRARKTREGLDLILSLWDKKKSRVDFSGKYYAANGAVLEPKPVQDPYVPLWFGTQGEYMLKVAARLAQGWLAGIPGVPLNVYERVVTILREEERKIGRKDRVKVSCTASSTELRSNLDKYVGLGCEVALLSASADANLRGEVKTFANEIASSYR